MSKESVKVFDTEIEQLAQIAEKWDDIDDVLEKYIAILAEIKDTAVTSGDNNIVVGKLYDISNNFYTKSAGLGTEVAKNARSFLSRIEEIDLNLYNG